MSGKDEHSGRVSAVKLALMARTARAQAGRALAADPIAIVGMGCRVPGGADTPESFWSFLLEERNVARPVPADRWDAARWHADGPDTPGRSTANAAAFLDRIDGFDSDYFGIPAREADQMDPQQRLFLEVATEAIENAGLRFEDLRRSRTGVFAASYHNDYAQMLYRDPDAMDQRTLTGTLHSVLANRVSYLFDLRGPSISIDTACSASLVAVHQACQSLRTGECDLALAGGVSVMLAPELMVSMSRLGFLAPDGCCKTFDASADGFGRGEGAGVLTLKRLSDALADRDRVWAVIRGSAVNQDGESTLLAAPNGQAQAALIREAVNAAQIAVEDLVYVETHGTGTALGDPIEVGALAEAVGAATPDRPDCVLGAVKANIGHLEAAAGVVGMIKAALVLAHRTVPAQPNFRALNPHIDLSGTRLKIADAQRPLPATTGSPVAGVSSFGVGGTNAHVLLEAAPTQTGSPPEAATRKPWILPLSARSPAALEATAWDWARLLETSEPPLEDLCFTAATRRSHHAHRLAVTGADRKEIADRLAQKLQQGPAPESRGKLCLVFCGQGPQHPGMGLDLIEAEPGFARHLERCDAVIRAAAGWSLLEELASPEALHRTSVAQPALVALQTGLAALLRDWGYVPDVVIGHSIGEVAAFEAAGLLSLDEALRIACHRGRIMQAAEGTGGMASVLIDAATARALVARHDGALSIAAVNGPRDIVLSGETGALDDALGALESQGVQHRRLPVRYAFHSDRMAGFDTQLVSSLGRVAIDGPARSRVLSTVTGTEVAQPDAGHFARGIRSTVRFAEAVAAAAGNGARVFVEVGPHPVLGTSIAACLEEAGGSSGTILPSLRRGQPAAARMADTAARLFETGRKPDWAALLPAGGRVTSLPRYPWQHRRHWREVRVAAGPSAGQFAGHDTGHPMLGNRLDIAAQDLVVFEGGLSERTGWLADHRIFGRVLMPGAAAMELLAAAVQTLSGAAACLVDFAMLAPLPIPEAAESGLRWQVIAQECDGTWRLKLVVPSEGAVGAGRVIAEARFAPADAVKSAATANVSGATGSGHAVSDARIADRFRDGGAEFGPAFRLLRDVHTQDGMASGRVHLPEGLDQQAHLLHPAALDAGVQLAVLAAGEARGGALLPVGAQSVRLPGAIPAGDLTATATLRAQPADGPLIADVEFVASDGTAAGQIMGLRLAEADARALENATAQPPQVCRLVWRELVRGQETQAPASWLVIATEKAGEPLVCALHERGTPARRVDPDASDVMLAKAVEETTVVEGPCQILELPWTGTDGDLEQAVAAAVRRLQVFVSHPSPRLRLALATQGACATGAETGGARISCSEAALQAFYATASTEHPELGMRLIDLDPSGEIAPRQLAADLAECLSHVGPARIALRGPARLTPVLEPVSRDAPPGPRALLRAPDGGIDGLSLAAIAPRALAPGEVRVAVRAAGLNFRDVLSTMGMLPGKLPPLGVEMAGEVIETAGDAGGLAPGDRVFGYAPGALAEEVIARVDMLKRTPEVISDRVAAGLTVIFGTALYGLDDLAGLRAGERVLIHAGTGGVGMAAIQIALARGAEVYATAGTEEKRALLRDMGVTRAMDSRSTDFESGIAEATDGKGVDVVLNALAGEFIPASVRCLSATGRFLELGKRDLMRPEDFAALRPDAAYHVYDLGQSAERDPALMSGLLDKLLNGLVDGSLHPVPTRSFGLDRSGEAMRFMAAAQHVGKIVIGMPPRTADGLRSDATYWITGGHGGLGLCTARWLAKRGARHILLTGRSAPGAEAREAMAEIEAMGVSLRTLRADAGDVADTARVLAEIAKTMPPLRGIVHAAGALRDGPVSTRTPQDVAAVLGGKLGGALMLDRLTRNLPLDFFILYSAAATFLGAPAQTLYAAANAGLDALALSRHREGLPALSIAWGRWSDVGMAARLAETGNDGWQRRGLGAITSDTGFAPVEALLASGTPAALVAVVDWTRLVATAPDGFDTAPLADLNSAAGASGPAKPPRRADLRDRLAGVASNEAVRTLGGAISDAAIDIIGLAPGAEIAPDRPMKELGLDSLMAVELRNALARQTALDLSATLLFDYPTLALLTAHLAKRLGLELAAEGAGDDGTDDTDNLSGADIEALLEAELALSDQYRNDTQGGRS